MACSGLSPCKPDRIQVSFACASTPGRGITPIGGAKGDNHGNVGMVKNKPAYVAVALGAQFTDTPLAAMDFLRPYIKALLGFIGFEQVEIFSVESTAQDEELLALSKQNAMKEIDHLFAQAVA